MFLLLLIKFEKYAALAVQSATGGTELLNEKLTMLY